MPPSPSPPLRARPRSRHFVWFRRMKSQVRERCFENVREIQQQLTVLREPPKS
jgi:hypothetical protein